MDDISKVEEEMIPRPAKAVAADCNDQTAAASFHEDEDNELFRRVESVNSSYFKKCHRR